MRITAIIIGCLFSLSLSAGQIFLDDKFSKTQNEAEAAYYYLPLEKVDEQHWSLTLYYAGTDIPYMKGFYNGPSIFENQRVGEYQYFYKTGELWIEGTLDAEERMHGLIRHHFNKENGGGIQGEYLYQHGVLDGEQKVYHTNGQISRLEHRVKGEQRGVMETYSENGQLYSYRYIGEKGTEGEYRLYHRNGELSMVSEYQAGQKHGVERHFYEDGSVMNEAYYHNGKQQGTAKSYNRHKILIRYAEYCADKLCGVSRSYTADGVLLTEAVYNKQGQLQSSKSFNPQGELTQQQTNTYTNGKKYSVEERYSSGQLVSRRSQDESKGWLLEEGYKEGKLSSRYETLNNQRQGQFIATNWYGDTEEMYYRNGELHGKYQRISADAATETLGQYQHNKKTGKWLTVTPQQTETAFYDNNGELHGHKTQIAANGTVLLSEHYQHGVPHGKSEKRNAEGIVISSGLYVKGKAHGRWIEPDPYYYGNDMLLWHGTYEQGVATGKWQGFSLRGHLLSSITYDAQGRRQGKSYTFAESGLLRNTESFYNDLLHGDKIMYLEGKPFSINRYELGKLIEEVTP